MVAATHTAKTRFCVHLAALLMLGCLTIRAQSGDAYRVKIKMGAGGPAVAGFLYAVNDTAVVVLPSAIRSPRGLESALVNSKPISIPTKLVKKVKVSRARSAAYDSGLTLALGVGYTLLCLPFVLADASMVLTLIVVLPATLITKDLIQSTTFRPSAPAFAISMQRYCLKKDGLVVDR